MHLATQPGAQWRWLFSQFVFASARRRRPSAPEAARRLRAGSVLDQVAAMRENHVPTSA